MSDVRFVERRGYLTLCLEAQGITRTYLRRTDGIRNDRFSLPYNETFYLREDNKFYQKVIFKL